MTVPTQEPVTGIRMDQLHGLKERATLTSCYVIYRTRAQPSRGLQGRARSLFGHLRRAVAPGRSR